MTSRMPYPLPDPCPVCSGPVTYSGRGPRPSYCSPTCRATAGAKSRPERRAAVRSESVAGGSEARLHAILDARPAHDLTRRTRDRLVATRSLTREVPGVLQDDGLLKEAFSREPGRRRPVKRDAKPVTDDSLEGFTLDGFVRKASRPRRKDPAAAWLAEHHPEELAAFGHDF